MFGPPHQSGAFELVKPLLLSCSTSLPPPRDKRWFVQAHQPTLSELVNVPGSYLLQPQVTRKKFTVYSIMYQQPFESGAFGLMNKLYQERLKQNTRKLVCIVLKPLWIKDMPVLQSGFCSNQIKDVTTLKNRKEEWGLLPIE